MIIRHDIFIEMRKSFAIDGWFYSRKGIVIYVEPTIWVEII